MKKRQNWEKALLGLSTTLLVGSFLIATVLLVKPADAAPLNREDLLLKTISSTSTDIKFPFFVHEDSSNDILTEWVRSELEGKRDSFKGQASVVIEELSAHLTEEEQEKLKMYEDNITSATNLLVVHENEVLFNEIVDKAREAAKEAAVASEAKSDYSVDTWNNTNNVNNSVNNSVTYNPGNSGVLTKSGGVNYYNNRKETWYSSNSLYHYRTNEWTAGSDGVYRDADGYVVVAASDLAQGSTIDTSYGPGKVYDSGCANGTTDIYVNW